MFALVLPDLGDAAADRLYSYLIPPGLQADVHIGGRVQVPLGTRQVNGFVLAVEERAEVAVGKVRAITAIKSTEPAFTAEQAMLARALAERYLCPISEALRPCLAESGKALAKRTWQCTDVEGVTTLLPDPTLNAVLHYIRDHHGAGSGQVRTHFGAAGMAALDALCREGLIRPAGVKRLQAREIDAVLPALVPTALLEVADALPARAAKQANLLRWAANLLPPLDDQTFVPLTVPDVARRAGVSPAVVRTCLAKGWLCSENVAIRRNPWETVRGRKAIPPVLTTRQQVAVDAVVGAVNAYESRSFLLWGVTGSGKTEVYLHAIERVLAAGRQAIVLVPEISLTSQAMALYHGRFPGLVAILHSHLSSGERYDEWQRIADGEAQVVLGARSAIFAPCPALGLIVIDEEHESSYKQESSPRYHAREVALERGRLCGAPVVLASATPSLESMHAAEMAQHTLLRLPERIERRPLPVVKLVDLRRMTANARILSHPLRVAISERLAAKQQVILFLNRRGYSHTLLCQNTKCGFFQDCPNCSVPLTYHKQAALLRCHHCDHQQPTRLICPKCGGMQLPFKGVGTERLEMEVAALWPEARLGRLDRDTTVRRGAHHAILDRFEREETDILIGTQMVAKGFDFPKVTLVGVIAADMSLCISDFRAPERTFQLLTQVAGRAGRSEWPGEVLVQTYQPEHYAIQAALEHDYQRFYRQEIARRGDPKECWPPLTALINVLISGEIATEVKATAAALSRRARELGAARLLLPAMEEKSILPGLLELLDEPDEAEEKEEEDPFGAAALLQRELPGGVSVNDATPCLLERLNGRYRYHLLLRGQHRADLRRVARELQSLTPPKGVLVVIDVDPLALA